MNKSYLLILLSIILPISASQDLSCYNPSICPSHSYCIRREEEIDNDVKVIEICQCYTGYNGSNCSECADGYFQTYNSLCIPCSNCQNNGTCINQTCICPDRFAGPACSECQESYFESSCLPLPAYFNVIPNSVTDAQLGKINLTVTGYNYNMNDDIICVFRNRYDNSQMNISIGLVMNKTHLICPLPKLLYDDNRRYSYVLNIFEVKINSTNPWLGYQLPILINGTCPDGITSCHNGFCYLDQCICQSNFQGMNCTECAPDYFNYPSCDSCMNCENQGTCQNQTCICSDPDRYIGPYCDECKPPYYYSPYCKKVPVPLKAEPAELFDVDVNDLTSVFFIGDNLNISGQLDYYIKNQLVKCVFWPDYDSIEIFAFQGNNTHILCPVPKWISEPQLYYLNLLFNNEPINNEDRSLSVDIIVRGTCPINTTSCANFGTCQYGKCICQERFSGRSCTECAENYFSYPICYHCVNCLNGGRCENQICICSDSERFTGEQCDKCMPEYYGPSCEKFPIILKAKPSIWNDTDQINVIISGANLNISKNLNQLINQQLLICVFQSYSYRKDISYRAIAHDANNTQIICRVPAMSQGYYELFVSLNNGSTFINREGTIGFSVLGTCPTYTKTCSYHGSCEAGICKCQANFAGKICSRCADGYFEYPKCELCTQYCLNNGTCVNEKCICSDPDRFTGYNCGLCQAHYYGKLCQQYPVALSIDPSRWDDIGNINVTIIGEHFNLSSSLISVAVQCRFSYSNEKYIYIAISANNTHIICPVKNMSSRYYSVDFSVDNGLTWYSADGKTLIIETVRTCPAESKTCSSNGICNMGSCLCNSGFSGKLCDQCAVGYYSYPNCYSCRDCEKTGSCKNDSCICYEPNRFTGIFCKTCRPPFYGPNCLQYPILQEINPTLWKDIHEINITITGDNFNISNILNNLIRNKFILCKFDGQHTYIYHAHTVNNTQIICQVSSMFPGIYRVSVSFTNGTSWLTEERSLYSEVESTCPNQSNACSNGDCIFGKCVCREGYSGEMCTECAENYFYLYSYCESCAYCRNNGICTNGTCTCLNGFTGTYCSTCTSHYYGSSCRQHAVLLSVQPTTWNGMEHRSVTLIGDHFNISGNISLDSVRCSFRNTEHIDHIISAVSMNNTHIICSVRDLLYQSYRIYFSLDNGTNWQSGADGNAIEVTIKQTCPVSSPTCSGYGQCSLENCLCNKRYAGQYCERCADGYFNYPNCYSCSSSCKNNGVCTNGSCICLTGFTGIDCTTCAPHYYGPSCEQYLIASRIEPTTWNDVSNMNLTIFGDHFNISGELDQLLANGSIQYSIDIMRNLSTVLYANNTHIVFPVPKISPNSYNMYFHLPPNSIQTFLGYVRIQPTCPLNGCKYGSCLYGTCRCNSNVEGDACDRCIDGFFFIANSCYHCESNCLNGGRCFNQTCVCSDPNRFTGSTCRECLPPYYGLDCLQIPIILSIQPTTLVDYGGIDVTISGDNFNVSGELDMLLVNKSVLCLFDRYYQPEKYTFIAKRATNKEIVCRTSVMPSNYYFYTVSLNNGTTWINALSRQIFVGKTCPVTVNECNRNGQCEQGKCICNPPWTGSTCQIYNIKPVINSLSNYTLAENESIVIDLSTKVIVATAPITYSLIKATNDESMNFFRNNIQLDHSTGLIHITNAHASLNGYQFNIGISNSGGTETHSLIINVPLSYTVNVKWDIDTSNRYRVNTDRRVSFEGNLTYFYKSEYLISPKLFVVEIGDYYFTREFVSNQNGFFNHSFLVTDYMNQINLAAVHPAYSWQSSSIIPQETIYVASLYVYGWISTGVSLSFPANYVNNFTNLIGIRNSNKIPLYNLSLVVEIPEDLFSCIKYVSFYPDSILSTLLSYHEQLYSLSILTNCSFQKSIIYKFIESRFRTMSIKQVSLLSSWSCRTKNNCTSHGQCIAHETCQCQSQYSGENCNQCANDYHNYPSCVKCPQCIHGTAICTTTQATCQCPENNHFFGPLCQFCQAGFYGPNCEAIPIVFSLNPTSGLDRSDTLVTIFGDNFNNHSLFQCILNNGSQDIILPGVHVTNQQIHCVLPLHSPRQVTIEVQINGTILSQKFYYQYLPSCPSEGCVHGRCAFGSCLCQYPYFGSNCTLTPVVPKLKPVQNFSLTEKFPFSLNLTNYLIEGDQPLSWWLDRFFPGLSLVSNETHTLLLWPSVPASSQPYLIIINVKNQAMSTIARQSFYLYIPIAYNVSIKFSSEYSQTTIVQSVPLRIQGQIIALDSNYQLTDWDSTINVWIEVNGKNRRYLPMVTAPKWRLPPGSFETYYTPLTNEYGTITVGASHSVLKQINDGVAQDRLIFFGMKIELLKNFVLEFRTGSKNNFTAIAKLINPTPLNITNLTISLLAPTILQNYSLILNCNESMDSTTVFANDECLIDLSLQFDVPYIGQIGFQFANNHITSVYLITSVNVKADRAEYSLSPSHRSLTIARNSQQLFSITIFNIGSQSSNKLLVRVPNDQPYLTAITPILPSINVSSNTTVTYLITILDSTPLSIIDIRSEIFDEENRVSVGMTFHLTIVGNNMTTANFSFLIEDEFTYFSPDAPHVVNTTIILISRNLGHRHTLITNQDGRASVSLIPDTYQVTAQANKHSSYSSIITVDLSSDGQVTVIFLQRQVISHTWTVTPKPYENEYTITLEAIFETYVPLPVITMDPMSLDLDYLENSNVEQMELIVTNHGLIRAEDVELNLPTNHPFLKFILLNDVIGDIEANSSIIVAFRIERSIAIRSQMRSASICLTSILLYKYECNGKKRTVMSLPAFHRSTSGDIPNSNCILQLPGFITVPPIITGGTGGGNHQIEYGGIQTNLVPITAATNSCRSSFDCSRALIECGLGFISGPVGCVSTLATVILGTSLDISLDDVDPEGLVMSGAGVFISCTKVLSFPFALLFNLYTCGNSFYKNECFSSRSLNIDPTVLAAYQDHQRMFTAMNNYIQIYVMIYGDENWLKVDDIQWWTAFDRARSSSSEMGLFLSQTEYQDLSSVLPNGANQSMTNDFLLYYNRTMTVWKYNTTETFSYLKRIDWLASLKQYQEDTNYANRKGYDDIMMAFSSTHQKLQKAQEDSEKHRGICASVKIRIIQKITLTREGFDAKLEMENTGSSPVENIQLTIIIKDNDNQHNLLHYFSIGEPTFSGSITSITGDGKLPSKLSGSVNWFIIPYSTAAPTEPTWYRVGGNLSYNLDGEFLHIPLTPDTILVQPDAQLHIAYFLDRYVIGPDSLITSPDEEQIKPEPFILAMLITNSGYGSANNFRITSGQPTIVENEKGLLINFEIISMNVNNTSSSPSLAMNIGNLQPFTTTSITWQMLASLKGQFHSFNATYTETNPNGDPKLSLLVSLTSHSLIRQVSLDIYHRQFNDGKLDYLVDNLPDGEYIPDTVFTSTNATISYPVYHILNVTINYQTIDSNTKEIIVIASSISSVPSLAFIYIRINNIYPNYKIISSSMRVNDGLNIIMNTWLTHDITHFIGENDRREDFLHIFDQLPNEYLRQAQQIYQITVKIQQDETSITPVDATTVASSTSVSKTAMTERTSITLTDSPHISDSTTTKTEISSMITTHTTEFTSQYSPTIVYDNSSLSTTSISSVFQSTSNTYITFASSQSSPLYSNISSTFLTTTVDSQTTSSISLSSERTSSSSSIAPTSLKTTTISSISLSSERTPSAPSTTSTSLESITVSLLPFIVDSYIQFSIFLIAKNNSWSDNSIQQQLFNDLISALNPSSQQQINISSIRLIPSKQRSSMDTDRNVTVLIKFFNSTSFILSASALYTDFEQQLFNDTSKLKQGTLTNQLTSSSILDTQTMFFCSATNTYQLKCDTKIPEGEKDNDTSMYGSLLIASFVISSIAFISILTVIIICFKRQSHQRKTSAREKSRRKSRRSTRS